MAVPNSGDKDLMLEPWHGRAYPKSKPRCSASQFPLLWNQSFPLSGTQGEGQLTGSMRDADGDEAQKDSPLCLVGSRVQIEGSGNPV